MGGQAGSRVSSPGPGMDASKLLISLEFSGPCNAYQLRVAFELGQAPVFFHNLGDENGESQSRA